MGVRKNFFVSPKIDFYCIFKLQFFKNLPEIFLDRRLRRQNLGASPPKFCPPNSNYWGGSKSAPQPKVLLWGKPPAPLIGRPCGGEGRVAYFPQTIGSLMVVESLRSQKFSRRIRLFDHMQRQSQSDFLLMAD